MSDELYKYNSRQVCSIGVPTEKLDANYFPELCTLWYDLSKSFLHRSSYGEKFLKSVIR